jgi:hypothetical protein
VTLARRWWAAAGTIAAGVSTPRIDVGAVDDEVEMLVRGSWSWTTGAALASKLRAAWMDSRCRRMLAAAASGRR